jgi:hypothetical protein
MSLPQLPFYRLPPGQRLIAGQHINGLNDILTGAITGVVALAGGGQSALTPQTNAAFTEVTTVATAADSIQLSPAKSGLRMCITNSGANSLQIFGAFGLTNTIQGVAGNVGVALAAGATAMFVCTKDNVWVRFVSA